MCLLYLRVDTNFRLVPFSFYLKEGQFFCVCVCCESAEVCFESFFMSDSFHFIHLFKKYFIEVWLTYIVVLVTSVQQSDSVMHMYYTHISVLFQILFLYKLV